jgi:hypothetical protein
MTDSTEPSICYIGFGAIYNEKDHWLKPREFEVYRDTPLVMHYINPDQCVIALQSSVHQSYHNEVLSFNPDTELLQREWNELPWRDLVKTCPQTNVLKQVSPRWYMWMSP